MIPNLVKGDEIDEGDGTGVNGLNRWKDIYTLNTSIIQACVLFTG